MGKHKRCMKGIFEKCFGDEIYDCELTKFCEVCQPYAYARRVASCPDYRTRQIEIENQAREEFLNKGDKEEI